MANEPSFKEVLRQYVAGRGDGQQRSGKRDPIRKFFDRWLNSQTGHALWEKVAADAAKRGIPRRLCLYWIIESADRELSALEISSHWDAKAKKYGLFDSSPKADRLRKEKFLKLAHCAETLANHYREWFRLWEGDGDNAYCKAAARWHDEEAQHFRQWAAGVKPLFPNHPQRRYQSRGKKFTRKQLLFMQRLEKRLQRYLGKPQRDAVHHAAVAAITNVVYPQTCATADDVRAAMRGKQDLTQEQLEVLMRFSGKLAAK
jgi:hypothetical protein